MQFKGTNKEVYYNTNTYNNFGQKKFTVWWTI